MQTTRLSTKGQVILPKTVRDAHRWKPGTKFTVEERDGGILLRPVLFPPTRVEDVSGCLKYTGRPATIEDMDRAIAKLIREEHARGRY
jgi:AbrB family looped-hinge helix DNA binding protein